jgi:NADH dehydrogenase FAD-containing subunit
MSPLYPIQITTSSLLFYVRLSYLSYLSYIASHHAKFSCHVGIAASAAVGTLEARSLVEPIRKVIARVHGHYIQAKAVDIDMSERLIEVTSPGQDESFYVP